MFTNTGEIISYGYIYGRLLGTLVTCHVTVATEWTPIGGVTILPFLPNCSLTRTMSVRTETG